MHKKILVNLLFVAHVNVLQQSKCYHKLTSITMKSYEVKTVYELISECFREYSKYRVNDIWPWLGLLSLHYLRVRVSLFICLKKGLNQFQATIFCVWQLTCTREYNQTKNNATGYSHYVAEKSKRDDNNTLTARQWSRHCLWTYFDVPLHLQGAIKSLPEAKKWNPLHQPKSGLTIFLKLQNISN